MAISPGGRPIDYSPLGHGGKNWVTKAGGLPPYIRGVARGINPADPEAAIDIAVSRIRKWAVTSKTPAVRAAAAAAIAQWDAMKATHGDAKLANEPLRFVDLSWDQFDANRKANTQARVSQASTSAQVNAHVGVTPSSIGAQQAAAGKKTANAQAAAAKKAAAAQAKAQRAQIAAQKKAQAAALRQQKAADALAKKTAAAAAKLQKQQDAQNAQAQKTAAVSQFLQTAGMPRGNNIVSANLSNAVLVASASDGGKITGMTGSPAFGGKKAAPFVKGGGRAPMVSAAKKAVAKRKLAAYRVGKTKNLSNEPGSTVDLAGKDGSTWKHDYIPTNAAAVALKAHKKPSGGGKEKSKSFNPDDLKNFRLNGAPAKVSAAKSARAQAGAQRVKDDIAGLQKHNAERMGVGRPPADSRFQVRERIEKPGTFDVIDKQGGNRVVSTHAGRNRAYAGARDAESDANASKAAMTDSKVRTSEQKATLVKAAERMHGSDRSKWSAGNLKSASKMGDMAATRELAKRSVVAKKKG